MSLLLKKISLPLAHFTLEVNLEMRQRVTAVFGPSGAGKTSLLDLIAGLRRAESAFIQLDDRVLTDTAKNFSVATHRRGIGYVPQDLALFPHLSVRQNLFYGRKSGETTGPLFSFEHVIKVLEIEPLISRGVTELSGGEKQRVALARALLASPRLLLLDEPLASLDAPLKEKIIPYLARIREEFQIPMLCVTHDRFVALTLADEIVVLMGGRVMQTGPVSEVFTRPANAAVAKFVGVETLQPGKIMSVADGLATVNVGSATLTALAPPTDSRDVFVCIRGEEVILQRDVATASSVRNRLSARVLSLRPEGALVRVELDAGFPLFALVTRPACAELELHESSSVTVLIKAPAIHLVPR
ncbi:MAG TPA: molybdenum ABC transporter ATP-binding protein [Candidatus Aquilonibacter sp.]|nr:molybdenum ABC transporter ATP-binding protein [Candidatus Aquilonibacter sp.]